MASRISVAEDPFTAGKYRILFDYEAERSNELSAKEGDMVKLEDQMPERGWIWATSSDGKNGFLPATYVRKVPGWDQWAYGCEVVSSGFTFVGGLFVVLYGSAEIDGTRNLAFGCLSMMASACLLLMIHYRDNLAHWKRMLCLGFCAILLFAGYPMGVWSGFVLLFAIGVEFIVWNSGETEKYKAPPVNFNGCCDFWRSSGFSIVVFLLWCGTNFAIFLLGIEYGIRRAEGWREEGYEIQESEWAFAQATGSMIAWNILVMLLFCLQGFQQMILAGAERLTSQRTGKCAAFKEFLLNNLKPEAMLFAHKCIAFTLTICTILHLLGAFAAYEHSGPRRDFMEIFGEAPFITGGLCIVILGIIIGSSYLDLSRSPVLFRNIHRLTLMFFALLLFHGADWWNPNFWKYMIGPIFLYCLDKMFRLGVFGYNNKEDEYETVEHEEKN